MTAEVDLRVQRIKWWIAILANPQNNVQLICTLFGKLDWEKNHTLKGGIVEQTANRYVKQLETDLLSIFALEGMEKLQEAITKKDRIDFEKIWRPEAAELLKS